MQCNQCQDPGIQKAQPLQSGIVVMTPAESRNCVAPAFPVLGWNAAGNSRLTVCSTLIRRDCASSDADEVCKPRPALAAASLVNTRSRRLNHLDPEKWPRIARTGLIGGRRRKHQPRRGGRTSMYAMSSCRHSPEQQRKHQTDAVRPFRSRQPWGGWLWEQRSTGAFHIPWIDPAA